MPTFSFLKCNVFIALIITFKINSKISFENGNVRKSTIKINMRKEEQIFLFSFEYSLKKNLTIY